MNVRNIARAAAMVVFLRAASSVAGSDPAMVLEFEGKKTKPIHNRVVRALKKADVALEEPGDDARNVSGDSQKLGALGSKHHVSVFVEGDVDARQGGGYTLRLSARSGTTGKEVGTLSLDAPKLPALMKKIDDEVPDFVKSGIAAQETSAKSDAADKAKPESDSKSDGAKVASEEEQKPEEPKTDGPGKARPSPLSVTLEGHAFYRRFSYNQDVNAVLRPYKVGPAPTIYAALAWYPGAHVTDGVAANIGLVGDLEKSIGTSSALDPGAKKYSTSMLAYSVGARWRIPLDAHEVGVSARYGRHAFTIVGDADPTATAAGGAAVVRDLLPNVAYQYLRPGLDARFAFGAFGVGAAIGYRLVLSAGDIEKPVWFPHAKVSALDASVFVSYEFVPSLHALAGFDLRRYGFNMHSSPSDLTQNRDVAGGAIDQYLAGSLGIEWRLPGASP